jgi:hypothetical protein
MRFLRNLFARRGKSGRTAGTPVRLRLEGLEDRTVPSLARVVPLAEGIDGVTTFHRLQDALTVATSAGDVVTVAPGSTADLGPVTVSAPGITITGDPNVPAGILPSYDVVLDAARVTLTHLHLGAVTINPDFSGDSVTASTVNTITATGGPSGVGNLVIDQNNITGAVSVAGAAGWTLLNVRITNNTFNTLVPVTQSPIVTVQDVTDAVVSDNLITGEGPAPQVGIAVTRGVNNVVANNAVHLNGGDLGTTAIEVQNPGGPLTLVTVRNNAVTTGRGRGLYLGAANDLTFQALVQGNDFRTNAVGVEYVGAGGTAIASDLGGGLGTLGGSLGGNNFHDYGVPASPGNAAIVLRNVAPNAVLPARFNIFDAGVVPASLVAVVGAGGTADVSQALSPQRAFVQAAYNDILGRTATLGELDGWVAAMAAGGAAGPANVVSGILRSDESLGRIVDGYYLQYLGRAPDFVGRAYWVGQIKSGMTLEAVQAGFASSPEFLANNNTDSVQGLYKHFFGRTGSPAELAYWYAWLPALGWAGVAKAFSASRENHLLQLTQIFNVFLHRNPSAGDMSYWSAQSGDLLTVEARLLGSGEFAARG